MVSIAGTSLRPTPAATPGGTPTRGRSPSTPAAAGRRACRPAGFERREKSSTSFATSHRAISVSPGEPSAQRTDGLLRPARLDRPAASAPAPATTPDSTRLENGRNVGLSAASSTTGAPSSAHLVATADTDTHGVVGQEAGCGRTCTWRTTHLGARTRLHHRPRRQGPARRRAHQRPMLAQTAGCAPSAASRERLGGDVSIAECAPWVDVDTVQLVRVSDDTGFTLPGDERRARYSVADKPGSHAKLFAHESGARGADVVLRSCQRR